MYDKFNEKLPKYWVVQLTKENQQEFKRTVGKYITNVYGEHWEYVSTGRYYGYDGNIEYYNGTNCYLNYKNFKNNPTILTLEEFKSYFEEFVLPEKWAVARDENNYVILNNWCNSHPGVNGTSMAKGYVHSHNYGSSWKDIEGGHFYANSEIKHPDHTEITFEQFKKYVLKQEEIMNKEIIGYKLKKDCEQYREAAKAITGQDAYSGEKYDYKNENNIKKLRDSSVLDLWFEPVYKEDGFKVGDLCYVINKSTSKLETGKVYPINQITDYGNQKYHFDNGSGKLNNSCWLNTHEFRKATPEEIAKAKDKELYFGKVKFTIKHGEDFATTEYGKVPKEDIKTAIDWIKNPPKLAGFEFSLHIPSCGEYKKLSEVAENYSNSFAIGFGCRYGKLSELEAIYKAFD